MNEFLGEGMLTPLNIEKSMSCNCTGKASRLKYDDQSFIMEMQKYSPDLAVWSREYALENLNIEKAVVRYLDFFGNADIRQNYGAYKTRLSKVFDEERQALRNALCEKWLFHEQFVSVQCQMCSMRETFSAKGRKHLRAIRALLWLSIVLMFLLVMLVCHVFL